MVTLKQRLKALAPGLTAKAVLEKLAAIQMIDVELPTTDHRTVVLSRHTEPENDHLLLLQRLKLELPPQSPPKITAATPHLAARALAPLQCRPLDSPPSDFNAFASPILPGGSSRVSGRAAHKGQHWLLRRRPFSRISPIDRLLADSQRFMARLCREHLANRPRIFRKRVKTGGSPGESRVR
jgi:hypothetical protein